MFVLVLVLVLLNECKVKKTMRQARLLLLLLNECKFKDNTVFFHILQKLLSVGRRHFEQ